MPEAAAALMNRYRAAAAVAAILGASLAGCTTNHTENSTTGVFGKDNDGNGVNAPAATVSAAATSAPEAASPPGSPTSPQPEEKAPTTEPTSAPAKQKVTFQALCESDDLARGCYTDRTADVGNNLFPFVVSTNESRSIIDPKWDDLLKVTSAACSSITVKFAMDTERMEADSVVKVRVLQADGPAVIRTARRGEIGVLTVKLMGGPFAVQGSTTEGTYGKTVVANGEAVCVTSGG
ncbi:hypothetical protein [Streptomyces microflavus]|uniref:hypothetical protein n=1 Tax=Streptomyces microflavus TaxID=1919 RepID=UPI00381EFAAC